MESQLVIFKLANEEYGVDILQTKEIIKTIDITKVPNSPEFIDGIINLRGNIIAIMDLRKKFNLPAEEAKHILISEINNSLFGLKIDEVIEIIRVDGENIKKAPSIISEKIHADYLKGVVILDERLIILLDLSKMLSNEELKNTIKLQKIEEQTEEKIVITDEEVEKLATKKFKQKK